MGSTGQDAEPGAALAVLYSLQGMIGRTCDFLSYTDKEILIAHKDVLEWINHVIGELPKWDEYYPRDTYQVRINLGKEHHRPSVRTTTIASTTTDFYKEWGDKFGGAKTRQEAIDKNGLAKDFFDSSKKLPVAYEYQPPLVLIEQYGVKPLVDGSEEVKRSKREARNNLEYKRYDPNTMKNKRKKRKVPPKTEF